MSRPSSIARTLPPGVRQQVFHEMVRQAKLPPAVPEFRFDLTRRWRFDYAWIEGKVALEVEGGVWTSGRHLRPAGFLKDCEKYNRAAVLGWRVLRCTPTTLCAPETVETIVAALQSSSPRDAA